MQLDRGAPPVIILQATAHATVSEETGGVDDDNAEVPAESELEGVHGGQASGTPPDRLKERLVWREGTGLPGHERTIWMHLASAR